MISRRPSLPGILVSIEPQNSHPASNLVYSIVEGSVISLGEHYSLQLSQIIVAIRKTYGKQGFLNPYGHCFSISREIRGLLEYALLFHIQT